MLGLVVAAKTAVDEVVRVLDGDVAVLGDQRGEGVEELRIVADVLPRGFEQAGQPLT